MSIEAIKARFDEAGFTRDNSAVEISLAEFREIQQQFAAAQAEAEHERWLRERAEELKEVIAVQRDTALDEAQELREKLERPTSGQARPHLARQLMRIKHKSTVGIRHVPRGVLLHFVLQGALIGFLLNSILQRVTGKLPSDDLGFPVTILLCLVGALLWSIRRCSGERQQ